nr:MAG: ORF1 [Torque teno polar bear virus 17]
MRLRRKRKYKSLVTQWNPQHRVGCKIKGWVPLLMGIGGHWAEKSEVFWQSSTKPDTYMLCGGSITFRHLTLGMLYQEHLLRRNMWSRSNASYDLARYFGTKLRFHPHEWVDYMVYWEENFEIPESSEMPMIHPAMLMNISKKKVVRSLRHKGRGKKLWLKPPPVHTNQWYFMKTWCNIPLFKLAVIPFNINGPFLHGKGKYGVFIGYISNTDPPTTVTWTKQDIQGSWPLPAGKTAAKNNYPNSKNPTFTPQGGTLKGGDQWKKRCYYRWYWDDGVDNYIMYNRYNKSLAEEGTNYCEIVKVNMPYWQYFWGLVQLTGSQRNPQLCTVAPDPSVYALTWYHDTECQPWLGTDDTPPWPPPNNMFGYPDQDLCSPMRIPGFKNRKSWVILGNSYPWVSYNSHVLEAAHVPDYDEVRERLTELVGSGPFVLNYDDVRWTSSSISIGVTYTSFWQWGGFRPSPDTTEDPCKIGDPNPPFPSKDRFAVQVEDPSLAEKITMHPWDFEQSGLYTQLALKRLISDVYPELSTENRRDGPSSPRALEQPKSLRGAPSKFRRIEGSRSPAESSGSSDNSSWADAASPSPSEAEETPPLQGPPMRKQRKRQHRSWKLERQRQRKRRKLVKFIAGVKGIKGYRP